MNLIIVCRRNFIQLPGRFSHGSEEINGNPSLDLRMSPELGAEFCEKLDFCIGLSQNMMGDLVMLEIIFLQNFTKDENWTSVALLSGKSNQWEDTDQADLDLCCPEQPNIPLIKIGRQEVPMQVSCDRLLKRLGDIAKFTTEE